mmetsp:Transcript_24794/g.57610  ORF Transcript_24794/g.57610 Transcript_24794/m.57610 type:complete len:110 (+) Transcript_24794:13-342(+)
MRTTTTSSTMKTTIANPSAGPLRSASAAGPVKDGSDEDHQRDPDEGKCWWHAGERRPTWPLRRRGRVDDNRLVVALHGGELAGPDCAAVVVGCILRQRCRGHGTADKFL